MLLLPLLLLVLLLGGKAENLTVSPNAIASKEGKEEGEREEKNQPPLSWLSG